jgi:phosphosulfolactate phosphohydrolase-like enzyme
LAWDAFAQHGRVLEGALAVSAGGRRLKELGYAEDIAAAARVDHFTLAPELRRDPFRVEVATAGIVKSHWRK